MRPPVTSGSPRDRRRPVTGAREERDRPPAGSARPGLRGGPFPQLRAARCSCTLEDRHALNCLMDAKPAAKAMSPIGRFLVISMRTRAVRARCARASASGAAPTSAVSSRPTCLAE